VATIDIHRLSATASAVVAAGTRLAARAPSLLKSRLFPVAAGFALVGLLALKFLVIPHQVERVVITYVHRHGAKLETKGWRSQVLGLSATAEGVKLLATGAYLRKELLKSDSVEFKLSLIGGLFGAGWLDEVRVASGHLYIERFASGDWNWQDVTKPSPAARSDPMPSLFTMDNMQLEWAENFADNTKASVRVDDVSMRISDLKRMLSTHSPDSPLSLSAQIHGGKVNFDGHANLFLRSGQSPDTQSWTPAFEGRIDVERLPADVLAPVTPEASIVPGSGTLTGRVDIRIADSQLECQTDLNYAEVAFIANQGSRLVKPSDMQHVGQLASYRAGGHLQFNCGGSLHDDHFRPLQASLIALIRQGLSQAPRSASKIDSGFDKTPDRTGTGEPSARQMREAVENKFKQINHNLSQLAASCRNRDFVRNNNPMQALQCLQICGAAGSERCEVSFNITQFRKVACQKSSNLAGYICDFQFSADSSSRATQMALQSFGSGGAGQGRFVLDGGRWVYIQLE